jgi:hypothetical protein
MTILSTPAALTEKQKVTQTHQDTRPDDPYDEDHEDDL